LHERDIVITFGTSGEKKKSITLYMLGPYVALAVEVGALKAVPPSAPEAVLS
jgi:hypothetical protein